MIPPGLRRSDATLQTTFDVETPSEHERDVEPAHGDLHGLGEPPRPANESSDRAEVEVSLVEPGALDPGHDLPDRRPDRLRVLAVERVPRPQEHDVGAAAERLGRAHRRADAEAPRDVVRRRDDAAAARVAADDERPRAQATGPRAPRPRRRTRRGRDGRGSARPAQGYGSRRDRHAAPARAARDRAARRPTRSSYGIDRRPRRPGSGARGRAGRRPRRPQATRSADGRSPSTSTCRPREVSVRVETVDARGRRAGRTVRARLRASACGAAATSAPRGSTRRLAGARSAASRRASRARAAVYVENLTTGAGGRLERAGHVPRGLHAQARDRRDAAGARRRPAGARDRRSTGSSGGCSTHSDNESANRLLVLLGGSTSGGGASRGRDDALDRPRAAPRCTAATSWRRRSSRRARSPRAVCRSVSSTSPTGGSARRRRPPISAQLHRAVWLASGGLGPLGRAARGSAPTRRATSSTCWRTSATGRSSAASSASVPGVVVLHKAGWIDAARHDAGLDRVARRDLRRGGDDVPRQAAPARARTSSQGASRQTALRRFSGCGRPEAAAVVRMRREGARHAGRPPPASRRAPSECAAVPVRLPIPGRRCRDRGLASLVFERAPAKAL